MLNRNSINAVKKSNYHNGRFVKPLHNSYCFSNVLPAVEALLTPKKTSQLPADVFDKNIKQYKNIVLFLVDGLGWEMFNKACKRSAPLKRISNRGIVSQLTAQFPSTTATAITTLHTGSPVGKHGIYEWLYYEPKIDAVISPLIFSFAEDKIRNTLEKSSIGPETILPKKTLYRRLKKLGVESNVFLPHEYFPSPYLDILTKGAKITTYKTAAEGLTKLLSLPQKKDRRTYALFYFDKIDSIAHKYGAASAHCEAEIDAFFYSLEHAFLNQKNKSGDTLILITTDHGQTDIDPEKTIYLNKEIPALEKKLKTTKNGGPIIPVGGCRDMFLHIKDEHLEEVYQLLKLRLKKTATIFKLDTLVKEKVFGDSPKPHLLQERCGNLMIAPYKNNLVWWNKNKIFTVTHKSHHGGLSEEEMIIPLISIPI